MQCFSCETAQNQWKPAEDPWVRHGRRSPSCDYVIEMRGTDFIKAIIDSVEKVKNTLTTYTRTASNSSVDKTSPEFTKMKNGLLNTQVVLGFQIKPVQYILWASNSNLSTIIAGEAARDKDTFVHWVAAGSVQGARGRRGRREHQRNRQEEEEKVVLTC